MIINAMFHLQKTNNVYMLIITKIHRMFHFVLSIKLNFKLEITMTIECISKHHLFLHCIFRGDIAMNNEKIVVSYLTT